MLVLLLCLIGFAYSLQIQIESNFPLKKNNFYSVINDDNYETVVEFLKRIPEFKSVSLQKDGDKLIIYIERYPIVKKIQIKGNLFLREYEIKNVLGLEENSPIFETNPETYERILTDYYRELGFLEAKVKVDIRVDNLGYAYVKVRVEEGDLHFLGDVLFEGAKSLSKEELLRVSGLAIGEVFNINKVLDAEKRVEDYYRTKGFLGSFVFYRGYQSVKFKKSFKYAIFPKAKGSFEKISIASKNLFSHPLATFKALVGKGKVGIPVYEVYEGEKVNFAIKGNTYFSEKEILSLFDFKSVGLDIFSLENFKKEIENLYKRKGFFDVVVDYSLEENGVEISINEGERYTAKVQIDGEYYEFPYDAEKIEKMIQEKINLLKKDGYLEANYKYEESIDEEKKEVNVFVSVEKGLRYVVESIEIKDELFKELNESLKTTLPTILTEDILNRVFDTINNTLKEKGYFDAQVNLTVKPTVVKDTVFLNYEILVDRGDRYTYGYNILYGYGKTGEREINYMLVKEKFFDKKNEEDSVWNLIESDIFESVQLEDIIDRKNKKVHRLINVKEKSRGVFEAFLGYSTQEKFKVGFGITLRNLFGIGLISSISYTKTDLDELYEVSLKDNFFFTRKLFTELSLFNRYDDRNFYELYTRGGAYLLGYRLGRYTSLAFSVSRFRAKTKGVENQVLYLTKLNASFRSRYLTMNLGKSISGKDYYTFESIARYEKELVKDLWGFRVKLGYGYASSKAPIFERFFLGGFQQMKGYSYQSIGAPTGKRQYLYLSPELYRVFGESLELIAFAEAGNAENKFSEIVKNLKYDIGTAVGLRTPVGLIRGELAYPLDKQKLTPKRLKFYLSVDLRF